MSTSGEQAGRPLTRRELRELRAQGGESAVRDALDAAGGASPDATPPEPHVVASAPSGADEHPPLTRRELRRLRTNEVPIVTPEDAQRAASADSAPDAAEDETPEEGNDDSGPLATIDAPDDADATRAAEDDPDEAPADEISAETQDSAWAPPEIDPRSDDAEPQDDVAVLTPATNSTEIPTLDPAFGQSVAQRPSDQPDARSFDELMENYAQTSPSSIIMTSSHRLPDGIGSTGAARGTTDGADVDAVLIDGELPPSSSPTPIAASSAISTQKVGNDVIRPPAPDKGRGLLMTLGITAAVLGIVAIGTLATLYFTGVFNQ